MDQHTALRTVALLDELVSLERQYLSRDQRAEPSVLGLIVAGVGFLCALIAGIDLLKMMRSVQRYNVDPSAIQITQVYTQSSFWMLGAIALVLVGILVVLSTRR